MSHNPGHEAATSLAARIGNLPMPGRSYPEFELETHLKVIRALRELDTPTVFVPGEDFAAGWREDKILEEYHRQDGDYQLPWPPWPGRARNRRTSS